jgi:hypothetical protein
MFDVYGRRKLFTFASVAEHVKRKRLLAYAYSKSAILKNHLATIIKDKTRAIFLRASTPRVIH